MKSIRQVRIYRRPTPVINTKSNRTRTYPHGRFKSQLQSKVLLALVLQYAIGTHFSARKHCAWHSISDRLAKMSTSKGPPNRLFSSLTNMTGPSQRLSTGVKQNKTKKKNKLTNTIKSVPFREAYTKKYCIRSTQWYLLHYFCALDKYKLSYTKSKDRLKKISLRNFFKFKKLILYI